MLKQLFTTISVVCLLATTNVTAEDVVSAPKKTGESKSLFNGKDLSGWDGDQRLWSVKDGVIHGQTTKEVAAKGNTFLIWEEGTVKDFELHITFRCSTANNSGIQYRSERVPMQEGQTSGNKWVVKGYQHELRNSTGFPNVPGFIYGEKLKGRGRICLVGEKAVADGPGKKKVVGQLINQAEFEKLFKVDQWNDVVIVAKGNHIQHFMNGRLILDFTDGEDFALREGVIALQLHAGVPMWAEFKDIHLKTL